MARKLTYALAASFQEYSRKVKEAELAELEDAKSQGGSSGVSNAPTATRKKFAIDLRSPEEMQQELDEQETEA